MAKRTIQSPGVEIRENDLSLRVPTPAGTTVYITGYTDQGPTDEVLSVGSISEFESIYGNPKTPAERYCYHTVKATLNSSANVLINRLPYGDGTGEGFGSSISVLAYPAIVAANAISGIGANTPLSGTGTLSATNISTTYLGASGATYLLGQPTQFNISQTDYTNLVNGTLFSQWSNSALTTFNSLQSLSGAAVIAINSGQTTIDGKYQGYYVGLADNTNINPASNYDSIQTAYTVTQSAGTSGLTAYNSIPKSRLAFSLTATPAYGNNPATNTVSQVMEEKITNYDIGTRFFDDTLNVGIFKLRQSVFANDSTTLDYIIEEGYNGSIGYARQINSENGGKPVNFFLENVENGSRNLELLVNPYISDYFNGIQLNPDGTPSKKVRVISTQLVNSLSAINNTYTATLLVSGLSASALSTAQAAYAPFGVTYAQFQAATGIGYGDALFPLGAYGAVKISSKSVGNIPDKISRALERVRNDQLFNIDIIAEGGLGTIWTTVCATGLTYFDDTKTATDIEALRTSNDLTITNARDSYTTIFNQFNTFCGPVKDGGRGDIFFIADPIRQIFVTGKDTKVINIPGLNFSQHIYWPLRHQFENTNTSYAGVFANYMKVYDAYSGLYIYVPSSGFAAARMASTDTDQGPWAAPAGYSRGVINDALDVALSPNQRQRDEFYKFNFNPVTRVPDQGIVVYGQKTLLKKPSAFDRINVRRSFLYLEKATRDVMRYFLFENNTLFTRTRVVNTLTPFFERVKQSDGLYDYLIVCDSRNNTGDVIDNNELVVDIYLKPVKSAEFILINFYATRTDTNFQELIGG